MRNYRQYVEWFYGIKIPSNYEVHHIDLDRTNCDIENLLILPKDLHHRYHYCLTSFKGGDTFTANVNMKLGTNSRYELQMYSKLALTLMECQKWIEYKMYLDGQMPNIHNIELSEEE